MSSGLWRGSLVKFSGWQSEPHSCVWYRVRASCISNNTVSMVTWGGFVNSADYDQTESQRKVEWVTVDCRMGDSLKSSRLGEQEQERSTVHALSCQLLFTFKHTPPPIDFTDSIVLSFLINQELWRLNGVVQYHSVQPCLCQAEEAAVPNVPLDLCPGLELIELVLQKLDIG